MSALQSISLTEHERDLRRIVDELEARLKTWSDKEWAESGQTRTETIRRLMDIQNVLLRSILKRT